MLEPLADLLKTILREVIAEELQRALAEHNGKLAVLLFDTEQAAVMLKLPSSWVASAARRGEIPCVRCGHHIRFKVSDLQQFIEKKKEPK